MVDGTTPAHEGSRVRAASTRWLAGALFMVGLLGLLRRHFDGFVAAPGVSVFGLRGSPLTCLLIFVAGFAGIAATRASRTATHWLEAAGALTLALALIGAISGGASAGGLAVNRPMIVLLVLPAVAAGLARFVERDRSARVS